MDNIEILRQGAEQLGISITDDQIKEFIKYSGILAEWNKVMNLTAIEDEKDVIIKHFLDSISAIPVIDKIKPSSIIDVGTGAGFPGIPLKIMNKGLEILLLDSLNKRLNFLNAVIQELHLEKIKTVHSRAEDAGADKKLREKFDVATARAVAQLPVLLEYCMPFVKPGGHFIAFKGDDIEEELKDSQKAIKILGGEHIETRKILLPYSDITHSIVIIKKIGQTPANYPRKAGKPSKEPLV